VWWCRILYRIGTCVFNQYINNPVDGIRENRQLHFICHWRWRWVWSFDNISCFINSCANLPLWNSQIPLIAWRITLKYGGSWFTIENIIITFQSGYTFCFKRYIRYLRFSVKNIIFYPDPWGNDSRTEAIVGINVDQRPPGLWCRSIRIPWS
jgi:hypothetical protein